MEQELLERIAAAPDDPALRAIWLDWLKEQGDPRGRPAPQPGRRAWLGPLAPHSDPKRCRFEAGVLSTLALRDGLGAAALRACAGDLRLSTVRRLELGDFRRAPDLGPLWASGRLGRLGEVSAPIPAALALARVGGLRPLEILELRAAAGLTPLDVEFLRLLRQAGFLPPARLLALRDDAAALEAPLARALGAAGQELLQNGGWDGCALAVRGVSLDGAGAWLSTARSLEPGRRWGLGWGGVQVWVVGPGTLVEVDGTGLGARGFEQRLLAAASALRLSGLEPEQVRVRLPPRRVLPEGARRVLAPRPGRGPGARLEVTHAPGVP